MVVGQQWVLNVGLLDWAYGTADSSLGATLAGIQLFDSQGNPVSDFSLTSMSGTQYVPEPNTALLVVAGLGALAGRKRLSA